ncbi:MAG: FAD-dependent oxidoreductase [Acidobacteria bacterium]|nr:FAD-dependent oxidoreductase [Acidobacteriota bacterium]
MTTPRADPGRVLIVGAGPTGLGAAHRLVELGHDDFVVLDRAAGPGGLAASVVDPQGFTWDIGGHVQFSHYAYYDEAVDRAVGGQWLTHERESWVWIRGRFVPYPFQNNLHRLDAADRDRALAGLEQAHARTQTSKAANFGEWIDRTFGPGLADLFMRPYNFKVWGYPLEEMDTGWMGERVAVPDLTRIREQVAAGKDDVSWGPNRTFRFPRFGGTGAMWTGMARLLPRERLRYGADVAAIDTHARTVKLHGGDTLRYDTIVTTMPLDRCCAIATPIDADVRRAAAQLRHSAVHVIGIGLRGPRPETLARKCWMYFPEPNSPYYRVTVFSNYSPNHVPDGPDYWSLMAEVCESPARPVALASLVDDTVAAMRHDRLIPEGAQVVSRWHRREEHGYPTPFLGRDDVLRAIGPALEAQRVFSRGRFGAWKYEVANQDHSFMQGVELVDRLVFGEPETTLESPGLANSGAFLTANPWVSRRG